jgi:hypothetical protein
LEFPAPKTNWRKTVKLPIKKILLGVLRNPTQRFALRLENSLFVNSEKASLLRYECYRKVVSELWQVTFRLIRDVAGIGTEFSRQDRKCFENRTPGKLKTSNDRG